jgi:hypothetical protein
MTAISGSPKIAAFFKGESSENGEENIFEYTVNRSFYDIKA